MRGMNYRSVAITGASNGIGAALAGQLAGEGCAMALIGRDEARLQAVAERCRARGADCTTAQLDIRDGERMRSVLQGFDTRHPIDLLVANAGILGGRPIDKSVETAGTARAVLETNLLATVETIHAVLPGMQRRRHGDMILVSSLAAFVPLADAPAYSAAKAGLLSYGVALRDALADEGIRVVVACPGFVATAMAKVHIGPRPGEVSADDAARRILAGLQANRGIIGFPSPASWMSRLNLLFPEKIRRRGMQATRFHVAG
ncbi:MAG: SDR family NAD(P)-dependent oxidoreductase [Alphaproteobacteria bacterium]|nr:SDR family NAD(P)-dependent oxidoreductase [Alphaproteobacteria bacterium]